MSGFYFEWDIILKYEISNAEDIWAQFKIYTYKIMKIFKPI